VSETPKDEEMKRRGWGLAGAGERLRMEGGARNWGQVRVS